MATYVPEVLQGVALKYGSDTTTGNCTITVDNLTSLDVPDQAYNRAEYTHLASTIKNFIPTIVKEAGELKFRYQYQATQYAAIEAIKGTTTEGWTIEFPDSNGKIVFTGFLMSNVIQTWDDPDAVGEVEATVQVNSAVSITAGTQGS